MSTAELLEMIKALPPAQQKEVEGFVHKLVGKAGAGKSFESASEEVFQKHQKLLGELAK